MHLSVFSTFLLSVIISLQDHDKVSAFQVLPRRHFATRHNPVPMMIPPIQTTTSPRTMACPTSLGSIFGGIFGGGSNSKLSLDESVVVYSHSSKDFVQEYEGLSDYIEKWAKMFTNGNIPLTTPVVVELLVSNDNSRGVRLWFKDTNTGYQSKNEEKESNRPPSSEEKSQKTSNDKGKKNQGGVEILVDKTNGKVQVRARRCEIEEDTVIKEMSEETILNELKQAIEVWKRDKV